jgi:hypothetical protein
VRLRPDEPLRPEWVRLLEARYPGSTVVPVGRAALGLMALLQSWRSTRPACKVAVSGAVCHEVILAVLEAGCEPLFCDVDVANGLVPESEWARARKLGAEVAVVVHLYGNPARAASVRALFPRPSCLVVDDAAQAFGSWSADAAAGAAGDAGLLSFGHSKQIGSGNAALLIHTSSLAPAVIATLQTFTPVPAEHRQRLAEQFRARFDRAREGLRSDGDKAAEAFAGLLGGLGAVLRVGLTSASDDRLAQALGDYPRNVHARIGKASCWSEHAARLGLDPVGMGRGCVPWRFTWRLRGSDWTTQHKLAEALRRGGMHVSNWYLPGHWLVGHRPGTLPGVECLAREVFQLWVDESVSKDSIARDAATLSRELSAIRNE